MDKMVEMKQEIDDIVNQIDVLRVDLNTRMLIIDQMSHQHKGLLDELSRLGTMIDTYRCIQGKI